MKLKRVKKIRDEWCDSEDGTISPQSLDDLKKHLEGDNPNNICTAMDLVTDLNLVSLAPLIARHLTNEWPIVREFSIAQLLGILKLPEYAEMGLKMAQEDESGGVRCLALTNLGNVLDKVDDKLKKKIASYLYEVMTKDTYEDDTKGDAYQSVMKAMGISIIDRLQIGNAVDPKLLEQFKEKYGL